ncbi:hypothetical protein Ahy_A10g050689 [Arachis hypogaea]|uniref:RNase H type-1 domain-containing protein n=1 Tax=Arachis hypogaea TaxID=3818 RepID=A0A445BA22_ARAHY|nr:hypothetical protein Ahy_A10g050689 [Arachis hypogaea]
MLCQSLKLYVANVNLPWCLVGDFNAMLHNHKKSGGALSNNHCACKEFQECVAACGLIDLGFAGWPYTWKRGNLVERLDRDLSNLEWQLAFPEAIVKHMPMLKSDHSPICLQLSPVSEQNRGRRPFCFLAALIMHPDFGNAVGQWDMDKLQRMLPEEITKKIVAISPPPPWKEADHLAWGPSSDGSFNLNEWLSQNLMANNSWNCLFGVAMSSIWYLKNKLVFNEKSVHVTTAINQIRARSEEFFRIARSNLKPHNIQTAGVSLISWSRPEEDCVKVNADELWAVIHGLNIATTNGYQNLIVESDSAEAINFINRGCRPAHPYAPLIQDIHVLTTRIQKITWLHSLRKANFVTDLLAKKGQELPVIDQAHPPFISFALL